MPDASLPTLVEPAGAAAASAAAAFERGVAARRAGKRDEAAGWLRLALEMEPAHRPARLELATTLREQQRVDEAEPLFRALLADDPGCWPALLGLGLCARLRRDLPASAEHLAAALALAARDRPVRLEYATTLREQRRIDEAEPIYRALLAEDPAGWPALVGLGLCARVRRDLPASAGHLAAALALAPRDRSVRLEYATTLRELRRSGEAEALYRALLADDPTFWPALLGLGLCARAGQDLATATAHLAAALALVPRDRAMRLDYAGLLREQRRLDDAEAAYGALHADEPDCWPALVGLGQCARLRRDLDASAGHLATALALAPREPSVRLEYATTLREAGRLTEAEPIYRELLADAPGWWPALVGLGLCARLRRDLVASDAHLAAALALAPDNRTVRLEYATTLREQRRLEEAETVYRKLQADDPGAWQATVGLGLCARMRNDRAAALARFTAAAEAHPEADGPWLEVAAEHREAGRYDAARAVLHTLRDRGNAVAEIWLGLGLVERLAGDRAAAAAAFREGYARHPQRHHLMIEIALDERALGHFAEAERWLRRAAEIEAVAGPALLQLGDLARARHNMDEAIDLLGRSARQPTAPVGVHAMLAQTLADLGRREEAFGVLDAADRQLGPTPETTVKRVFLLRRAGFREEALAVARAAVAAMPDNFPLWIEWFETERFSGDFAGIDRILAAAPAATVHDRARLENARGALAAQRWQPDARGGRVPRGAGAASADAAARRARPRPPAAVRYPRGPRAPATDGRAAGADPARAGAVAAPDAHAYRQPVRRIRDGPRGAGSAGGGAGAGAGRAQPAAAGAGARQPRPHADRDRAAGGAAPSRPFRRPAGRRRRPLHPGEDRAVPGTTPRRPRTSRR